MKKLILSFQHAFSGIIWVLRKHQNFKIHVFISFAAIILALFIKFTAIEFTVLLLTILIVYTAEMVNTAVEEVTNLLTIKWAKQAKIAKDVSAGMVLIAAIGAIIIGLLLFIPKLPIIGYRLPIASY